MQKSRFSYQGLACSSLDMLAMQQQFGVRSCKTKLQTEKAINITVDLIN